MPGPVLSLDIYLQTKTAKSLFADTRPNLSPAAVIGNSDMADKVTQEQIFHSSGVKAAVPPMPKVTFGEKERHPILT